MMDLGLLNKSELIELLATHAREYSRLLNAPLTKINELKSLNESIKEIQKELFSRRINQK